MLIDWLCKKTKYPIVDIGIVILAFQVIAGDQDIGLQINFIYYLLNMYSPPASKRMRWRVQHNMR